MTFSLQYEIDFRRVISAVINDSRWTIPALQGTNGMEIYAYIQSQIALVTPGVLVYRLITDQGVIAGVVGISGISGEVGVILQQLRPSFIPYLVEINQFISIFIASNAWVGDTLY